MNKLHILFVFTFLFSTSGFAQSPSITIGDVGPACLNKIQQILVGVNGVYQEDNKFRVQVRERNKPVAAEIPAQMVNGKIEVIHTDSSFSLLDNVEIRVVTTSPQTQSNWYNTRIHSKGFLHLSVAGVDTINLGEPLSLLFTGYTTSTAWGILSDSSSFSAMSGHQTRIAVPTEKPIYVVRAQNSCGAVAVSGEAKARINPTSLRVMSVFPESVCEGSEFRVRFATFGPALPSGTRYRLRLRVYVGGTVNDKIAEVPAELKDNMLVARFPANLKLERRAEYGVRIITESPSLVSPESYLDFIAYPKASVTFDSPSKTIEAGEKVRVSLLFSGVQPFSATLEDGTVISSNVIFAGSDFKPERTTAYKIKSFTTGCGRQEVTNSSEMLVTVKPGIALYPEGGENAFCAGTTAKVKMLSSIEMGSGTSFAVHAVINGETAYTFPARKVGDQLEFFIPVLASETPYARHYDKVTALYITADNPSYRSAYAYDYEIRSKPEMVQYTHSGSSLLYKYPSVANFGYELRGKGPFDIEDAAGGITTVRGQSGWYPPNLYVDRSFDFEVKSISNACGKNESVPTAKIVLDTTGAPRGIQLRPLEKAVCRQDSLSVSFTKTGTFNPGNVFHIEAYIDCCNYITLATVNQGGRYRVKVPVSNAGSAYVRFRVRSTNPEIITNMSETLMQVPLENLEVRPFGTLESPKEYMPGIPISISVGSSVASASSFVYSDGVKDVVSSSSDYITPPLGKITSYTIKSATNPCGTVPVNLTTYILVLPYTISIIGREGGDPLPLCLNSAFTVPFVVVGGDASKATFTLQMAPDKTTDFRDVLKNHSGGAFQGVVPADLVPGRYQIRVISSDGGISNILMAKVGALPSATLSIVEGEPSVINAGQGTTLQMNFTGSPPWAVLNEDNETKFIDDSPYFRRVTASQAKDFYMVSLYNGCGYGPVTGKVAIKVNPGLTASRDSYELCPGAPVRVRFQLTGDINLTEDYLFFQLVDKQNNKVTNLDSTRARGGEAVFILPEDLTGDAYELRAVIRSYNLSTTLPVTIRTKVDVSISGSTTINSGESTRLVARTNRPVSQPISYKLSDGQAGMLQRIGNGPEYHIRVSPTQTTTYSLLSVNNGCVEGKVTGSATVVVNPVSDRTVNVTKWEAFENSAFCVGRSILIHYEQKGNFSAGNRMTVQFSDTTGINFQSVETTGTSSPLKAFVPAGFFVGKHYRVRVVASDAGTASGAFEYPLTAGDRATARFLSNTVLPDPEVPGRSKLEIALSGTGPWSYTIASSIGEYTNYPTSSPHTFYFSSDTRATYYEISRVSNHCGVGEVVKPDRITLELITGIEKANTEFKVVVAPNPAAEYLKLSFPDATRKTIRLLTTSGVSLLENISNEMEEVLKVGHFPAGIYILSIENGQKRGTYKVVKR